MQEEQMEDDLKSLHRKFAVECFNRTWDLIDKKDRTPEDNTRMVHSVHASRYHWGEIGTPLEFARGDWQISRVYAILEDGASAMKYAESSLNHCLENNIGDFDLAFAYEALARAAFLRKDSSSFQRYLELAKASAQEIELEEDRSYFLRELESIS
jgi:hypothetical protein